MRCMPLIYVTGDCEGVFDKIVNHCDRFQTSKSNDVMIILGDHGLNYFGEKESRQMKKMVSKLPLTFVLVRGNHDRRPSPTFHYERNIDNEMMQGSFYTEEEFPNLLHVIDGRTYRFDGKLCFAMGGAFSVDGRYRRMMYDAGNHNKLWFSDEQLSAGELDRCHQTLREIKSTIEEPLTILAHTCPLRFIPTEKFLPGVDQSKVDKTMERRFDRMFSLLGEQDRWLCGHFHTDKVDGPVRFLHQDIITL